MVNAAPERNSLKLYLSQLLKHHPEKAEQILQVPYFLKCNIFCNDKMSNNKNCIAEGSREE